jgi:hypothetical protein
MARTPKRSMAVAEAAKKPEVTTPPEAVKPAPPPKASKVAAKVFEVVDGMGRVMGEAGSQKEADELVADHRAAGRPVSHVRERGTTEPQADAEAAGE